MSTVAMGPSVRLELTRSIYPRSIYRSSCSRGYESSGSNPPAQNPPAQNPPAQATPDQDRFPSRAHSLDVSDRTSGGATAQAQRSDHSNKIFRAQIGSVSCCSSAVSTPSSSRIDAANVADGKPPPSVSGPSWTGGCHSVAVQSKRRGWGVAIAGRDCGVDEGADLFTDFDCVNAASLAPAQGQVFGTPILLVRLHQLDGAVERPGPNRAVERVSRRICRSRALSST
ncbi:hypothetical protein J2753_002868 [Halolamina salifodinae]|uniref:Uncharacterized protein n=1 Tax=Halolamina salifodinae TaxID=1202767 RepID=A0A8T4GZE2_9EURY|nr:hypothetical protein [Halolamina salifodinae]